MRKAECLFWTFFGLLEVAGAVGRGVSRGVGAQLRLQTPLLLQGMVFERCTGWKAHGEGDERPRRKSDLRIGVRGTSKAGSGIVHLVPLFSAR